MKTGGLGQAQSKGQTNLGQKGLGQTLAHLQPLCVGTKLKRAWERPRAWGLGHGVESPAGHRRPWKAEVGARGLGHGLGQDLGHTL